MNKPAAIWSELDFRLSVVNRWQVMPTIRKQTVAEHQHNVAKIAERLALEVFEWGDSKEYDLAELIGRALEHDDLEAIIGDPPSYTKPWVDEKAMTSAFKDLMRSPRYPLEPDQDVAFILKAADYIDAMVFLQVELSMGNNTVIAVLKDLEQRFYNKCKEYNNKFPPTQRRGVHDAVEAWFAYQRVCEQMFGGDRRQLKIEGFRFA